MGVLTLKGKFVKTELVEDIKGFSDKDYAAGYALFQLNSDGTWDGRTVFPYIVKEQNRADITRLYDNSKTIYKK